MATHEFVYQTFVIYIFIKSLVFLPLVWIAFLFWWSERKGTSMAGDSTTSQESSIPEHLPATELLVQ